MTTIGRALCLYMAGHCVFTGPLRVQSAQSIKDGKTIDSSGSAFYVAEHYLLTCKHLVSALKPGDQLSFSYRGSDYSAVLVEIAEHWDLALLYTETPAQEKWIYLLDRVALVGREAVAYGYPHGLKIDEQRDLKIGSELDEGVPLTNANGVTIGFSGGPVCPASDLRTAIGSISTITGVDAFGRRSEGASFVPARVMLDLWGDKYGLWEKRYFVKPDAFGKNNFVYSTQKTAFQDPYGYLNKLREFLLDERPVLWWAVLAPGGSGKSRLCYELASSLNSDWRCELLQAGQLKKDHLQKLYEDGGRSFLLLADYAYTDTDELGEWLEQCARTQNGPRIRVLLLQREAGSDNYGWQESLLSRHRNLINLRYQKDLQLETLKRKDLITIMHSYAENMGGGQIDASALYTVLENVDPGLTRPLFAMFITDAALHRDDPRGWDWEKALEYFIQREKDVVDRVLDKEDAKAAMLLLIVATIADGFKLDTDLLSSMPLCEIQDFNDLSEKAFLGRRLYNARFADRDHECYIIKPMKPDLLGEYYVLDSFRGMMNDSQRKDDIFALLCAAKKINQRATGDFLIRLFSDYDTDEKLVSLCCGEDDLFQFSVSQGLVMRLDTMLLQKIYEVYGTVFWQEQYAKGLFYAINKCPDPEKVVSLLDELRALHGESPENAEITETFAWGLFNTICGEADPEKAVALLDELRALHEDSPENAEIMEAFAKGLFNTFNGQTDPEKVVALLDEIRVLYELPV